MVDESKFGRNLKQLKEGKYKEYFKVHWWDYALAIIAISLLLSIMLLNYSNNQSRYIPSELEANIFCDNLGGNFIKFTSEGFIECGRVFDGNDKRIHILEPLEKGKARVLDSYMHIPFLISQEDS